MNLETFFASAAILIGFVMIFLTAFTWIPQGRVPWPRAFQLMLTSATVWVVAYSFDFFAALIFDKLILAKIAYLGITTLPVFWFAFSLHFVNQSYRLTGRIMALLLIIPIITILLVSTNELHMLIWSSTKLLTDRGIRYLSTEYGYWFWVHAAYSYVLLLIGTIFMFTGVVRFAGRRRLQAFIVATAVLFPWVANVIYLGNVNPFPAIDWTPIAMVLSCISFLLAVLGFKSLPWSDASAQAQHQMPNRSLDQM